MTDFMTQTSNITLNLKENIKI